MEPTIDLLNCWRRPRPDPKPKEPEPMVPESFEEYARQYGWVQDKTTQLYGPFRPNKHQLVVRAEIERRHAEGKPALIIVLKSRQLGMTTYVIQDFLHRSLLQPGRHCLMVVQDSITQGILHDDKLRNQFDHLPEDLRIEQESNRRRLVLGNGSRFVVQVSTGIQTNAKNLRRVRSASQRKGRGGTFQYVHGSEVAFWVDASTTMLAINQMNHPVPGNIRVYESTANGKGGAFHDLWYAAVRGENDYTPLFFSWKDDEAASMPVPDDFELTEEEADLVGRYSLQKDQLMWRRWKIANDCNGDSRLFQQEYPLDPDEAFLVTGNSWFDVRNVQHYKDNRIDPVFVGDITVEGGKIRLVESRGGPLKIYRKPLPGKSYAIGGDVGEGTRHGNFSCAQVGERDTLKQCAVWFGRIDPDLFAHKLCLLGLYYNRAMLAPERNGPGIAVIPQLYRNGYPDERIYKAKRIDRETGSESVEPGWKTTPHGTRRVLCSTGRAVVRDMSAQVYDLETLNEMMSFVDPGNGIPQAAPGSHDDAVLAWLIMITVAGERLLDYEE